MFPSANCWGLTQLLQSRTADMRTTALLVEWHLVPSLPINGYVHGYDLPAIRCESVSTSGNPVIDVLKQISPTRVPVAPNDSPSKIRPSFRRARSAFIVRSFLVGARISNGASRRAVPCSSSEHCSRNRAGETDGHRPRSGRSTLRARGNTSGRMCYKQNARTIVGPGASKLLPAGAV